MHRMIGMDEGWGGGSHTRARICMPSGHVAGTRRSSSGTRAFWQSEGVLERSHSRWRGRYNGRHELFESIGWVGVGARRHTGVRVGSGDRSTSMSTWTQGGHVDMGDHSIRSQSTAAVTCASLKSMG